MGDRGRRLPFEEKFLTSCQMEAAVYKFSGRADSHYLDIGAILKTNFRFSADAEVGLEIADILANATRRALAGNLAPEGYLPIRRLIIHRRHHYISCIALHGREIVRPSRTVQYCVLSLKMGVRSSPQEVTNLSRDRSRAK